MPEYAFQIRGREDLSVPNGSGESGYLCWVPHYDDNRIPEIKNLISKLKGKITSHNCLFTPSAGVHYLIDPHIAFSKEQAEQFKTELSSRGYNIDYRELSEEEIQRRNDLTEKAIDGLLRTVYV